MLNDNATVKAWIKRLEALFCTGMPGVYRIVSFFAIQHIFSLSDLGHVASNMAVAQMAGFFSAIGWATLILVRIPAAESKVAAKRVFYRLFWMALCTCFLIGIGLLAIPRLAALPFESNTTVGLLFGWTVYQLPRHYFVAQKRYRAAISFDVILTLASCTAVYGASIFRLAPSAALAMALGGVGFYMLTRIGFPNRNDIVAPFEYRGLEFGLANFVSGGVTLIFAPLASLLCGSAFAGVFSLLVSATAFGALLPRAISLNQLATLSKFKTSTSHFSREVARTRNQINLANWTVLFFNVAISTGLVLCKVGDGHERDILIIVATLLSLLTLTSASGITCANVLMVFERSRTGLVINIKSALLFAIAAAVGTWTGRPEAFIALLAVACLINVWKKFLLSDAASREILIRSESHTSAV